MPFWQSTFGKVLRWILFLPVAFVASAVLETIPVLAFGFAATWELKLTLLTLILGIVLASLLLTSVFYWGAAVFLVPKLTCRFIAPTPKVATVIFGTLFVFCQALTLLLLFLDSNIGWGLLIYKILFSLLLVGGTVAAYFDEG